MVFKNISVNISFSLLFSSILLGNSFATQQPKDDLALVPGTQAVYKKVFVPKELTHQQIQELKKGELVIKTTHLAAEDMKILTQKMPGNWRILTNTFSTSKATLVHKYTQGNDPSTFTAVYRFPKWFDFTVIGYDEKMAGVPFVKDIDADAAEMDKNALVPYNYNPPAATHMKLLPEELMLLGQHLIVNNIIEVTVLPQEIKEPGTSGFQKAVLHGGKHVFSFVVKPLIKKHVPYAKELYPEIEAVVKTLGYPTITHFLTDVVQSRGKLSSPLLIEDQKKEQSKAVVAVKEKEEEEEEEDNTALQTLPKRNERVHATSRFLGHAVSMVPFASAVRTAGTMYVSRQGYPTLTHWAMGLKEMTDEQVQELRSSQTKLAEEFVALGVETFIPYGGVLVAVSQTGASVFLDESSMTAWAIHKAEGKGSKEKQTKQ